MTTFAEIKKKLDKEFDKAEKIADSIPDNWFPISIDDIERTIMRRIKVAATVLIKRGFVGIDAKKLCFYYCAAEPFEIEFELSFKTLSKFMTASSHHNKEMRMYSDSEVLNVAECLEKQAKMMKRFVKRSAKRKVIKL